MDNWIEYRRAKAIVRKVTRRKKRENFIEFAEKLNKNISLKFVWNKIKVLKNRDNKQDWNKWRDIDREGAIWEQTDKIGAQWVNERVDEDRLKELEFENRKDVLIRK